MAIQHVRYSTTKKAATNKYQCKDDYIKGIEEEDFCLCNA